MALDLYRRWAAAGLVVDAVPATDPVPLAAPLRTVTVASEHGHEPDEGTQTVYRWTSDAYLEILIAERGEEVRPEPFEAIPLRVGALFGDDEPPTSR